MLKLAGLDYAPSPVCCQRGQYLIELGVIAGVIFEVLVEELVAGCDDEGGSQLLPAAAGVLLTVSGCRCPQTSLHLGRLDEIEAAQVVGTDDLGGRPVFVQEHVEGDLLIFDEGFGIPLAAGADGNHPGTRGKDLVVSIADLTGPLAAGQSAEVAEEQDNVGG